MPNNFEKMMQIIEETFATRNDPGQIEVSDEQRQKLEQIHPATMSQLANEDGPLIWVLLIPTTKDIMNSFISGKISEKELLSKTNIGEVYNCIYLCSASTLPEARGKGQTKALAIKAIKQISDDHSIDTLFVWPFSKEGELLAKTIAKELGMKLLTK